MTDAIFEPVTEASEAPLARPSVAPPTRRSRGILGYGVIVLLGGGVLVAMTAQRNALATDAAFPQTKAAVGRFAAPEPLPGGTVSGVGPIAVIPAVTAPQFAVDNAVAVPMPTQETASDISPQMMTGSAPGVGVSGASRLAAPAMIVDLSEAATPAGAGAGPNATPSPAMTGTTRNTASQQSDDQAFSQAVGTPATPATANRIGALDQIVAEGTILSATLETAINSDLPGFARAVISRNVVSFDGSQILIPRGTRVIGQYKSGIALGASRVFVIWTRLIRPDGVSVQLLSPGGDDLGRGGLTGRINRHFLQRFGGSILTSVLDGVVQVGSAALGGRSPVYINTMADATAAASSAVRTGDIPPTIRTPQGMTIKIFVARDLNFSAVSASL